MSESYFDSMGEDMMVEVFSKVGQNLKALVRLRCVSKSWRRLVNSQCLHMRTCNDPLAFKGHLMKVEFGKFLETKHSPVLAYTAHRCWGDGNHFDQEEEGRRLLENIEDDKGLVFLDACNGLLLHRLKNDDDDDDDDDDSSPPPVYRVSNLETNSRVMVNGEADTADSMYNKLDHAMLAYDPAESLVSFKIVAFFRRHTPAPAPDLDPAPAPYEHLLHKCMRKIVAFFQQPNPGYIRLIHKCMRIYSSDTSKWTPDLYFDHHLQHCGLGCRWKQQSIYLNGAIYRLPRTRYLLRFEITDKGSCDDQYCRVQAIQPPKGTSSSINHVQVGINKGQINLASMAGFKRGLKVWVLQEEGHGNNYSYQWILKHRIRNLEIPTRLMRGAPFNINFGLLGFHPYKDAVVLFTLNHYHFHFICWHLDRNLSLSTDYHALHDTLGQHYHVRPYFFPLFSCAVPLC